MLRPGQSAHALRIQETCFLEGEDADVGQLAQLGWVMARSQHKESLGNGETAPDQVTL